MKKFIVGGIVVVSLVCFGWWSYTKFVAPSTSIVLPPDVAAIISRGKLVVGTDPTYPPMEEKDASGHFVGFDMDLAQKIAEGIGVPLEVQPFGFDELFDKVAEGSVDLGISSISITPERSTKVLFSNPYLNAGQVIVTSSTNTVVKTLVDLSGKTIAVQKDTTSEIEAKKLTAEAHIVRYPGDYTDVVSRLIKGDIDAIIIDYPVASQLVRKNKLTKMVGNPFTSEFYGVVTSKLSVGLIARVNVVLSELKQNGSLARLEMQWLQE